MPIDKYFVKTYDIGKEGDYRMRKTIFISHITEEAKLARLLKQEIESRTAGYVDVFVSSDGKSIEAGKEWLEAIKNGLNNADLMIALCSKESVARSWVNFEIGAGWSRQIHVIPACHTNILPSQLTKPIDMLQGVSIGRLDGLKTIFEKIAEVTQGNSEKISQGDYSEILARINDFEEEYGFTARAEQLLKNLMNEIPEMSKLIEEATIGNVYELWIPRMKYSLNEKEILKLKEMDIMSISTGEHATIFGSEFEPRIECRITLLERFSDLNIDILK